MHGQSRDLGGDPGVGGKRGDQAVELGRIGRLPDADVLPCPRDAPDSLDVPGGNQLASAVAFVGNQVSSSPLGMSGGIADVISTRNSMVSVGDILPLARIRPQRRELAPSETPPDYDGQMALPFDRSEFSQRYERIQSALDDHELDTFLCFSPENIYYITGFETLGYYFPQCLVIPHGQAPILVLREFERPGCRAHDLAGRGVRLQRP